MYVFVTVPATSSQIQNAKNITNNHFALDY